MIIIYNHLSPSWFECDVALKDPLIIDEYKFEPCVILSIEGDNLATSPNKFDGIHLVPQGEGFRPGGNESQKIKLFFNAK